MGLVEMMVAKGHPISMARASGWRGILHVSRRNYQTMVDMIKKTCKKPNDDDNEVHFDVIYLQE
jgi:hypothetical protein